MNRIFMVEFGEESTAVTFECESLGESSKVARTLEFPNDLASDEIGMARESFNEVARWATDPTRLNEPQWARPKKVVGVEFDTEIIQLTWTTERGGVSVDHAAVVHYEEVQEMVDEALDDVQDIISMVEAHMDDEQ